MTITVVEPPSQLAVDFEEALGYLRLDEPPAAERALIERLLKAITRQAEASTGRAFVRQTLRVVSPLDPPLRGGEGFDLVLPRTPVIELQGATSPEGEPLSEEAYRLRLDGEAVRFKRGFAGGALSVRYACGYGTDAAAVPDDVKAGLLKALATIYEDREDYALGTIVAALPQTSETLFDGVRRRML